MDTNANTALQVIVSRYIHLIETIHPKILPIKRTEDTTSLEHCLWMLHKMQDENYVPKTSISAWISWVQCCLISRNLANSQHELDVSRSIHKQYATQ